MARITMNLIYPNPETKSVPVTLSVVPRIGDFFQIPYGKGKRYRVAAVVFGTDSDASAIMIELVDAPSK